MRIAVAQTNSVVADLDGNYNLLYQIIQDSAAQGVGLVIFPDCALTGTPLMDIADQQLFAARCAERLAELAAVAMRLSVDVVIGHDGVKLLRNGQVLAVEEPTLAVRCGHNSERSSATCQLHIVLENQVFKHEYPDQFLQQQLAAHDDGVSVFVNQACGSTDTLYYGGSFVVDHSSFANSANSANSSNPANTQIPAKVLRLPLFESCVAVFEVADLSNSANLTTLSASTCSVSCLTANAVVSDWGDRTSQMYQATVFSIREYFTKNNFSDCCIALSGGIDSAVVVALAVIALGAEHVRVIMLPSEYSSSHSVDDSLDMVNRTGIVAANVVSIAPIMEAATQALEPLFCGQVIGLAHENMQSRIRLMLTMALSNHTGALMLNTSNKSEIAVGYGTLYGDTSGALSILGDLYKSDVYLLARHINTVAGNLIPENIISKPPSAELRPDQYDSDSLPDYDTLDSLLCMLIEEQCDAQSLMCSGRLNGAQRAELSRTARMLWNGDFKRHQLPPIVRLSGATFNVERHYPITKCRFAEV